MAAKPSVVPTWGTAATNIATPDAGLQATGWPLNAEAVSSYFNWLGKYTAEWLEYLKDGVLSGVFSFDDDVNIAGDVGITGELGVGGMLEVTDAATISGTLDVGGVATADGIVNTGPLRNSSILTPTAISANQNNYAPTGHADAFHFRLAPSGGSYNITGLGGGVDGREVVISNINLVADGNTLTLAHNNGSSSAANRFYFAGGTNVVVASGVSVRLIYDGTTALWRRVS